MTKKINPLSSCYREDLPKEKIMGGNSIGKDLIRSLKTYYKNNDALYKMFEFEEHAEGDNNIFDRWEYIKKKCTKLKIKVGFLTIRPQEIYKREEMNFPNYYSAMKYFVSMTSEFIRESKYIICGVWCYEWSDGHDGDDPRGGHMHLVFEYEECNEDRIKNLINKRNNKLLKNIAKIWNIRGGTKVNFYSYRYYYKDKIQYMTGETCDEVKNYKKINDKSLRKEFDMKDLYLKNTSLNDLSKEITIESDTE